MLNETAKETVFYETSKFIFNSIDYTVLILMLSISTGIGIYFGFFDKSANTTEEYLLGGKKMKTIPIAISLVASQLSAIAIMSIPAEFYQFGIEYVMFVVAMFFVIPVLCFIIIPVFYKNNIANCYEYLEMRFDKKIRRIITASFVLKVYLLIPIYTFVPTLAFSQVTGYNIHVINAIVCSICVFYTMLGGIKAVVWTDVVQGLIMLGSVILVATFAVIKIGGLNEVISRAVEGNRWHSFDMSLDLTTRQTFWNCLFGGITMWISHVGVHQSCVQRIVSLPSLTQARISLLIFGIGFFCIMGLNCFTGIIMYARYYLCDPVKAGVVKKADKLMPFFVQDVIGHLKGMPGLFISCVFSAGLSTMSANLNTLAGLVYFDYVKPFINHSESRANFFMKIIVVVNGLYCILAGVIVEQFSSILQVAIAISGMTQGAVTGVFLLGMLYPKAHSRAALIATICSMLIMAAIVVGGQIEQQTGVWKYRPLPTRTIPEACNEFNVTIAGPVETEPMNLIENVIYSGDQKPIFRVSFYWFSFLGATLVWLIGLPLSHLMKNHEEKKLNIELLSPIIQSFVEEYNPKEEQPLQQKLTKL